MKRIMVLLALAVIVTALCASPAWAWTGHKPLTELVIQGMSLPFSIDAATIASESVTPDSWGEIHGCAWPNTVCQPKGDQYFDTWTSSAQVGYGCHYLEDAGQPYHAANEMTGTLLGYHEAFEVYAKDLIENDGGTRSVIIAAYRIPVTITSNTNYDHIQKLVNAAKLDCDSINNLVKRGPIANLPAAAKDTLKRLTKKALDRTSAYLKGALEYSLTLKGTTIGFVRGGYFYLRNSNTQGNADIPSFWFGGIPVTGDWDGNGTTTVGRYSGGVFYLKNSNSAGNADYTFSFGATGDIPVTGDWNGDGKTTVGVWNPKTGLWSLRNSNSTGAPDIQLYYGSPGDIPVTGDWNGDGKTTVGVWRTVAGVGCAFFLRNYNTSGNSNIDFWYGSPGDIPVTGDWDGNGTTTVGIWRNGAYCLRNSNTGGNADILFWFGSSGDIPITGNWDGVKGTKGGGIIAEDSNEMPSSAIQTDLIQCAPNPSLNGQTAIRYQLASPANVSLKVYNIQGQLVKTLANEPKPAGYHSVKWDGKDANGNKVAAGVYLYRMSAGDYSATRKMTVIR